MALPSDDIFGALYLSEDAFIARAKSFGVSVAGTAPDELTPGGPQGPGGDNYLYAHFQVDAQGTMQVMHGVTLVVYGLNLNNEVFGFYNGNPRYVVQREFYKPTFAVGVRCNPSFR